MGGGSALVTISLKRLCCLFVACLSCWTWRSGNPKHKPRRCWPWKEKRELEACSISSPAYMHNLWPRNSTHESEGNDKSPRTIPWKFRDIVIYSSWKLSSSTPKLKMRKYPKIRWVKWADLRCQQTCYHKYIWLHWKYSSCSDRHGGCHSSSWRLRQEEFEASLNYTVSSKPAWSTKWDPAPKHNKEKGRREVGGREYMGVYS